LDGGILPDHSWAAEHRNSQLIECFHKYGMVFCAWPKKWLVITAA